MALKTEIEYEVPDPVEVEHKIVICDECGSEIEDTVHVEYLNKHRPDSKSKYREEYIGIFNQFHRELFNTCKNWAESSYRDTSNLHDRIEKVLTDYLPEEQSEYREICTGCAENKYQSENIENGVPVEIHTGKVNPKQTVKEAKPNEKMLNIANFFLTHFLVAAFTALIVFALIG